MQQNLKDIFTNYINNQSIFFTHKDALTDKFLPDTIKHREKEINMLARIVAPSMRGEKISNTFIFGITGTGKTMITKYVTTELEKNTSQKIS